MPKPVVHWALVSDYDFIRVTQQAKAIKAMESDRYCPVLVLPMPTLAAAKKRLRWERMTEGQKVDLIAGQLFAQHQLQFPIKLRHEWADMAREQRECKGWYTAARQLLSLIQP